MQTSTLKRIAIIVPSLRGGGLERVAVALANLFSKHYDCHIIIITLKKEIPFYELREKVCVIQPSRNINIKFLKILYLFLWVIMQFNKQKLDAVLSFGESYNSFVIATSMLFKHKTIVSNRASPLTSLNGIRGFLNPMFYPMADSIILQTKGAYEILKSKYKGSKLTVIPNPVRLFPHPMSDPSSKTIINVGYFGGKKNQDLLIEIFADLWDRVGWKLHFIGEGPKRHYSEEIAKKLKVEKSTVFFGERKNIESYLSQSSIFAFTSTSEGFPNALAEAMAAGLAVISFNCISGPSDLIDDGENGFLIPVGNKKLFQIRLQELIKDESLRKKFGDKAREKMKLFDERVVANSYYKTLID